MLGRWSGSIGALLVGGLVVAPSYADDAKTYPASFCQPVDPDFDLNDTSYDVPFGDEGQGAKNVGDDDLWLTCPIVRDTLGNTNGLVKAYLNVDDSSSTDNFACTLYAISRDGTNVVDSETRVTSGTGFDRLVYNGIDSSGTISTYHIFCEVPPSNSRIYSYRIIEHDP